MKKSVGLTGFPDMTSLSTIEWQLKAKELLGPRCMLLSLSMNVLFFADFFIIIKEPAAGVVQVIYDLLAVQKTKSGLPMFVFWDQKCLNFGKNWESGFLSGLKTAKVIVLLITNKVNNTHGIILLVSNIHNRCLQELLQMQRASKTTC